MDKVATLARSLMNEQSTGTMPLAPKNNNNCCTRWPVELQSYMSSYTTGEKRTNRNNAPNPQNNSNCYTRGPVELQAYESCYTTGEKRTIEQTTGTMPLAPKTIATAYKSCYTTGEQRTIEQTKGTMPLASKNNSNCYTSLELQSYASCYATETYYLI